MLAVLTIRIPPAVYKLLAVVERSIVWTTGVLADGAGSVL